MNKFFNEVKRNFGFGCMRLPMIGDDVDIEQVKMMVDYFIDNGFNYFDTAHGYINQKSEIALHDALTSRYSRDKYILANKLSGNYFKTKEDVRPFFEEQLKICGVDYFDFYLMHAQNANNYKKYKECEAYKTAFELKKEGKIRHVGMSFHDTSDVLDMILTENPEIEFVQIQFNYLDYDDPAVQSKKCYDVCVAHSKPVVIMEPIKGGTLINLPDEAQEVVDGLNLSKAELAVRFCASHDNVFMVLSGMSTFEQMKENVSFMKDFKKLTLEEMESTKKIVEIFDKLYLIKCTACRYCVEGCPKKISIPDLFACLNSKRRFHSWNSDYYYSIHTKDKGKASDCIKCGKCEAICPQGLNIRELLQDVASEFEK